MKCFLKALCVSVLLCLSVLAVEGFLTTATAQETKVLEASKDNILLERTGSGNSKSAGDSSAGQSDVLSNGNGPTLFIGRTGQNANSIRRSLIAFDIAGAIPAGSRITSVKLSLNVTMTAGGRTRITLHRVLSDWGEGNSSSTGGRGAQAEAGDATWFHTFYPDKFWKRPGGDFVMRQSSAQVVDAEGTITLGSTRQMVVDVQAWLNSPKKNYGWLLRGDETKGATAVVCQSSESEDAATRPQADCNFYSTVRKKKKVTKFRSADLFAIECYLVRPP